MRDGTPIAMLCIHALLPCAAAFRVVAMTSHAGIPARRASPQLALDEGRAKLIQGGLPQKFAERVSFQSSGQRIANQEDEILILWKEFKKCYPSEAVAQEMLSKNTAVILPQLNSPRKIKGTYALLNTRLGKVRAAEVLEKNPGVLICSPESLEKQSDDDIVNAANLVDTLNKNKAVVNAFAGALFLGIVCAFIYRIGTVGATPPGM
ncbi:hypothetical protein AB1Y20_021811 [Prymnesium parvum]|uniref:Uncharacterized protein n=1 Tax=Prymnesium parvum TaxID=97485 RepID=A0AB34JN90_PRYPA